MEDSVETYAQFNGGRLDSMLAANMDSIDARIGRNEPDWMETVKLKVRPEGDDNRPDEEWGW